MAAGEEAVTWRTGSRAGWLTPAAADAVRTLVALGNVSSAAMAPGR